MASTTIYTTDTAWSQNGLNTSYKELKVGNTRDNSDSYCEFVGDEGTTATKPRIVIEYSQGIVYYGVGGQWKPYLVYYGTGGQWKQVIPYYGVNGEWKQV